MNASFTELKNSYKRSITSVDDETFTNDSIYLPVKPMNGYNESNNRIKVINKERKCKQNLCMSSSIQVGTKMRKEHTCTFCKQKGHSNKL